MNIFCPDPCTTCAPVPGSEGIFPNPNAEANPFSNFTSEEPDVVIFNPDPPTSDPNPPLGSFNKQGCISMCISTVSQAAADICAFNQQVLCIDTSCLSCPPADFCQLNPNSPACVVEDFCVQHPDALGCQSPTQLHYNDAQQCTVTCPDGTPFTFVVPANTFLQPNKALANALAYSYACNKANQQKMCLSEINQPVCCTGQTYDGIIVLTAGFPTTQPFSFAVTSGALPPDLVLSSTSSGGVTRARISGITNSPGTYTFQITASHPSGVSSVRQYTITVIGIATSGLASGTVGTPYSETLTAAGPVVSPIWSVSVGALPDGLVLDALTGVISGTPTTEQTANFAIRMNAMGVGCFKIFSIEIENVAACPDWNSIAWDAPIIILTGAATGSALAIQNTITTLSAGSPGGGGNGDTATLEIDGVVSYNSAVACNCNLELGMTKNGADTDIQGGVEVEVFDEAFNLVAFPILGNQYLLPADTYNFPFSVPATGGQNYLIRIHATAEAGVSNDTNTNGFGLFAVFTNV